MWNDPKRRKKNLIIGGLIIVLGLAYSFFGEHKVTKLTVPEKTDMIIITKVADEETLSDENRDEVLKILKSVKVTKNEKRNNIEKEEYPDSYEIALYEKKNVREIYYLLPDGRIYHPANRKVYTLEHSVRDELIALFDF